MAVAHRRRKASDETPLPRFKVFVLLCITVSEGFALNMLFPFVPSMVESFGYTKPSDVSFYAAFIGSAFGFAQFLGSFYWGFLSDRYGRRPVLLIGLLGSCVCMVAFGFSNSLAWAIVTRGLNGLLNGNSGVARTYMREITDSTNQARGFALFGTAWGVGSILGPTAGGYLSAPEKSLPWLFSEGSFFSVHAYLLPCVVSASVNVFGFLMGLCYLHETHPNPRHLFECWRRVPSTGGASTVRHVQLTETHSDTESVGSSGAVEHGPVPAGDRDSPATTAAEVKAAKETDSSGNCVPPVLRPQETQIPQQSSGGVKHVRHRVPAGKRFWQSRSEPDYAEVSEVVTPHTLVKASLTDPRFVTPRSKSSTAVLWELLHTPAVLPILVANSNLAFTVICLQELFPLWASSPVEDGGLAFEPRNIGTILAFSGAVLILYSTTLLPVVERRMGPRRMVLVFTGFYMPVFVFTPWTHFFVGHQWLVWGSLACIYFIRATAGPTLFSASGLLANNASASHVGSLNGLLVSCMALVRAIGPGIGGTVLSWSQSNGLGWPLDYHFVFMVLALLMLVNIVIAARLPTWVDVRAEERSNTTNSGVDDAADTGMGVDMDAETASRASKETQEHRVSFAPGVGDAAVEQQGDGGFSDGGDAEMVTISLVPHPSDVTPRVVS